MSSVIILVVVVAAIALALALAYLPMRLLLQKMARDIAAPIRAWIERERDRRVRERQSPDRRRAEP